MSESSRNFCGTSRLSSHPHRRIRYPLHLPSPRRAERVYHPMEITGVAKSNGAHTNGTHIDGVNASQNGHGLRELDVRIVFNICWMCFNFILSLGVKAESPAVDEFEKDA